MILKNVKSVIVGWASDEDMNINSQASLLRNFAEPVSRRDVTSGAGIQPRLVPALQLIVVVTHLSYQSALTHGPSNTVR